MRVGAVMSPSQYFTLDGSWSVAEVYRFFKSVGEDVFCVERDGKFLGLVTRESVSQMVENCGDKESMERVPVGNIILSPSSTPREDQSIADVLKLMRQENYSFLPVQRGEQVVGLVSRKTLVGVERLSDF